jgi:hypothetical protein
MLLKKYNGALCAAALGLMIITAVGCSSPTGSYDSFHMQNKPLYGKIAKKSMNYEGIERNPVIVVHGFLGAKLENTKTEKIVWGAFKGIDSIKSLSDDQIRDMSHPMGLGKPLKDLKNDVVAAGLLDKVEVTLLGFAFYLDAYDKLIEILLKSGYVEEGEPLPKGKNFYSLFIFYYDWRRDLVENSERFHKFVLQKKKYLQNKYLQLYGVKDYDVQFDVIAHSMGGLLSRYYLRYGDQNLPEDGSFPVLDWRGAKNIDKLIIVGTPNSGYLDTCLELVNGLQVAPGMPAYQPGMIGTFPSYYQMLPLTSTKSLSYSDNLEGPAPDVFDPKLWIAMKWGLLDPNQDYILKILLPDVKTKEERRKIALDHLKKCLKRAKQFTEALRIHATPPEDVSLFLFLGDSVKTRRKAAIDKKTGKLTTIEYEPGDGKVLSSSARFDEREGSEWSPFLISPIAWDSVMHLRAAHMGITASPDFADNATYLLLVQPTKKQKEKQKINRMQDRDKNKK